MRGGYFKQSSPQCRAAIGEGDADAQSLAWYSLAQVRGQPDILFPSVSGRHTVSVDTTRLLGKMSIKQTDCSGEWIGADFLVRKVAA